MKYIKEANKGYSQAVYNALDDTYVSEWDGKVDPEYISDNVELFIWNTERNYNEIFNTRRKATAVAYQGLCDLFQENVNNADVNVRITSEMVKQWCKKHGIDFIEMLKPVVARIEEEREERKKEKSESLKLRISDKLTESEDEIARKGFCSLVKDSFYGGYIVLNDGYFVCKISAPDDSDAERQFYDFLKTDWKADWKNGTLPRYYDERPKDYEGNPINYFESKKKRRALRKQIRESAWTAPNGKKYGKQKRDRKTGRYLFTRKELKDMVDSGIAKAISNAEQAWKMSDEVIGYSWNETNGFKSGILFTDKDGNLWVGNTGVAQMFL